jgi:Tol biopolymer transport system component
VDGEWPVYSPTGHILYQKDRFAPALWALPFSLEKREATGPAFLVAQNASSHSVAANGTLLYLDQSGSENWQLVWRDRAGNKVGDIGQPQRDVRQPVLSPDGSQVAVRGIEEENADIWIHDVDRPVKVRITYDLSVELRPAWHLSGQQLAFSSLRGGSYNIFSQPVDGNGETATLTATSTTELLTDISPDDRHILFVRYSLATQGDLWHQECSPDGECREELFLRSPFHETGARFSPDGRWVAYSSDESGRSEIYVRRYPSGAGRVRISSNGGHAPRWGRSGRKLFYVERGTLVEVLVRTGPAFSVGTARKLFRSENIWRGYDVSADEQRFVLPEPLTPRTPPVVRIGQNWFAEFRARQ